MAWSPMASRSSSSPARMASGLYAPADKVAKQP
jgi:hypothetical protein